MVFSQTKEELTMKNECLRLMNMEDGFVTEMKENVEPYLRAHCTDGLYTSHDGKTLHFLQYDAEKPKAVVVICHGFSEFAKKYNEMVYYLLSNDYSVFIPEHRGHGESEREVEDLCKVYVKSFDHYIEDLNIFYEEFIRPIDLPKCLIGHSMGGGISLMFLEKYPDYFDKAVLSSPMVKINMRSFPENITRNLVHANVTLGHGESYVFGQKPFSGEPNIEHSSCKSESRYEYTFGLRLSDELHQTSGATFSWLNAAIIASDSIRENAEKIKCETLIMFAGQERLVDPEETKEFVEAYGFKSRFFESAKHEVYNSEPEDRVEFYTEMFEFLEGKSV